MLGAVDATVTTAQSAPSVARPLAGQLEPREAALLAEKLRSAERALEDERLLSNRERAVYSERLKFVESQDEAVRERLAKVLQSLRVQQDEVHAAARQDASAETAELRRKVNELQRTEGDFESRLWASLAATRKATEEFREASTSRDEIASKLNVRQTEQELEAQKCTQLQRELQRRATEAEEHKKVSQAELALATEARHRLSEEIERLKSTVELNQHKIFDWEAKAEADRKANTLGSPSSQMLRSFGSTDSPALRSFGSPASPIAGACQPEDQTRLEANMFERLSFYKTQLALEQAAVMSGKDKLEQCMSEELSLKASLESALGATGRAESIVQALTEDKSTTMARMHSEIAAVSQVRNELAFTKQQALRGEASLTTHERHNEQEHIARMRSELRAELRIQFQAELHDAEVMTELRVQNSEQSRFNNLRHDMLDSAQSKWHLEALHKEASEQLHAAREAGEVAAEKSKQREVSFEEDLQATRRAYADLHERTDSLRREMQDEVREWRAVAEHRQFEMKAQVAEAEQQHRIAHNEMHAELQRLQGELRLRSNESQAESTALEIARKRELQLLTELRGVQASCSLQPLDSQYPLYSVAQRGQLPYDHPHAGERMKLRLECAELEDRYRHEENIASGLLSRCSDLERQLQAADGEAALLQQRVRELQVATNDVQAHVAIRNDQSHGSEPVASPPNHLFEDGANAAREYRRRAAELENELHAAEFEMRRVASQARAAKTQALKEADDWRHTFEAASHNTSGALALCSTDTRTRDLEAQVRDDAHRRVLEWETRAREESRRECEEFEAKVESRFREQARQADATVRQEVEIKVESRFREQARQAEALIRQEARQRVALCEQALRAARESETAALEQLKKSEAMRREGLVAMDALIGDARSLAQSLSSHHVAKDLTSLVDRHSAIELGGDISSGRPRSSMDLSAKKDDVLVSCAANSTSGRGAFSDNNHLNKLSKELDVAIQRHQESLTKQTRGSFGPGSPLGATRPHMDLSISSDMANKESVRRNLDSFRSPSSLATSSYSHVGVVSSSASLAGKSLYERSTASSDEMKRNSGSANVRGEFRKLTPERPMLANTAIERAPSEPRSVTPSIALVCGNCGNVFMEDSRFCRKCGQPRSKTPPLYGSFTRSCRSLPPTQARV